jgi:hypothetical protein
MTRRVNWVVVCVLAAAMAAIAILGPAGHAAQTEDDKKIFHILRDLDRRVARVEKDVAAHSRAIKDLAKQIGAIDARLTRLENLNPPPPPPSE